MQKINPRKGVRFFLYTTPSTVTENKDYNRRKYQLHNNLIYSTKQA
jgi:uncharacterized protein (UPF0303 family)